MHSDKICVEWKAKKRRASEERSVVPQQRKASPSGKTFGCNFTDWLAFVEGGVCV